MQLLQIARGSAALLALSVGCGGKAETGPNSEQNRRGSNTPRPGIGDGDHGSEGPMTISGDGDNYAVGDGDGDLTTASGGSLGDGDAKGSGGTPQIDDTSDFVLGGRGTSEDGSWDGYLFTAVSDNSSITPSEITGSNLCVSGVLGAGYEEWAILGWNIAQLIDPDTFEGGPIEAISPGGTGVEILVRNNAGSGLRIQLQSDEQATQSWCAAVPAAGGVIPWSDFTKECWAPGGAVYDRTTPISTVSVQTYAGSDSMPTAFDFCVLHLGPA